MTLDASGDAARTVAARNVHRADRDAVEQVQSELRDELGSQGVLRDIDVVVVGAHDAEESRRENDVVDAVHGAPEDAARDVAHTVAALNADRQAVELVPPHPPGSDGIGAEAIAQGIFSMLNNSLS